MEGPESLKTRVFPLSKKKEKLQESGYLNEMEVGQTAFRQETRTAQRILYPRVTGALGNVYKVSSCWDY